MKVLEDIEEGMTIAVRKKKRVESGKNPGDSKNKDFSVPQSAGWLR